MNRRHEPRVRTVNLVDVGEFNEVGLLEGLTIGRTLDLSHDGMRVELNHAIETGKTLTLDLELGERILEIHGVVRELHPLEAGMFSIGVELTDANSPEIWEVLEEFLTLRADD